MSLPSTVSPGTPLKPSKPADLSFFMIRVIPTLSGTQRAHDLQNRFTKTSQELKQQFGAVGTLQKSFSHSQPLLKHWKYMYYNGLHSSSPLWQKLREAGQPPAKSKPRILPTLTQVGKPPARARLLLTC